MKDSFSKFREGPARMCKRGRATRATLTRPSTPDLWGMVRRTDYVANGSLHTKRWYRSAQMHLRQGAPQGPAGHRGASVDELARTE